MIGKREAAAQIMEHVCRHDAHGYSQPNRAAVGTGGGKGETIELSDGTKVKISTGDLDCSSAVIQCFAALGVDCGGAWSTSDMAERMLSTGNFEKLPAGTWRDPERGDILLRPGVHTALALGGGKLGEALRSENHSTHGERGDQDGGEVLVRDLYDDGWTMVLRYVGPDAEGDDDDMANGFGGKYTCREDGCRVRTAPSLDAETVAHYDEGQTVTLDDWCAVEDGWVWGRYTAKSGKKRYIAVAAVGETKLWER